MDAQMNTKKDFDLEVVLHGFRACLGATGSLNLNEYLHGFGELTRFFRLMGRVFGFVATDLQSRIKALEALQNGENSAQYDTIQSAVSYEVTTGVARRGISGCRNLLELHRSLEFIALFMDKVSVADDNAKTSDIASEIYTYTLGKHHNWIVRKMAVVAMYTLPKRRTLIEMMCKHDVKDVENLLKQTVGAMRPVQSATEKLLVDNNLLDM